MSWRVWPGTAPDLVQLLIREARLHPAAEGEIRRDDGWQWRTLAGVVVATRWDIPQWARLRIRVAQADPDSFDPEKWIEKLGLDVHDGQTPAERWPGYYVLDDERYESDKGKGVLRLVELRTGEIRPGVARCARCWFEREEVVEIDWTPNARIHNQLCAEHLPERAPAKKAVRT